MPHFKTKNLQHISSSKSVLKAINKLPKDKLILIDNLAEDIKVRTVYQDFKNDIYKVLE
jgi:hypothetical protein